ncbi:zinc finger protein ZAT4-like [Herrania umbratica]|uniref:Zinc finger protein ZAT4-like n=1 Tax=Herrania umbratica TaxID=108875 RepID=A0A6J0ZV21_9ROSI|nr:zinc finger protein ZAT4-like [Herrania umbratica]
MVPGDTSIDFLVQKLNADRIIKFLEEGDGVPDQSQDPTIRVCRYCHREFKSAKALGGHLRIHSQYQSGSSHGKLRKPKRAKAVNGVHQCEICGKTFQTGQALGGHKTYHRVKPVVDPSRGWLVRRKAKEQLSGESGQVIDRFSRMPLPRPGELSGEEAHPSVQSNNQGVTKRLLDFDLNIPYIE